MPVSQLDAPTMMSESRSPFTSPAEMTETPAGLGPEQEPVSTPPDRGVVDRDLEHEPTVSLRSLGEREALLESSRRIDVPLDERVPASQLDARAVLHDDGGRRARPASLATESIERDERGPVVRDSIEDFDAVLAEDRAQLMPAIRGLQSARRSARAVLARGDDAFGGGEVAEFIAVEPT